MFIVVTFEDVRHKHLVPALKAMTLTNFRTLSLVPVTFASVTWLLNIFMNRKNYHPPDCSTKLQRKPIRVSQKKIFAVEEKFVLVQDSNPDQRFSGAATLPSDLTRRLADCSARANYSITRLNELMLYSDLGVANRNTRLLQTVFISVTNPLGCAVTRIGHQHTEVVVGGRGGT